MHTKLLTTALLLVSSSLTPAWSAIIDVPPGNNTLAAAVAAASDGDTLVLRTGAYTGSVTVNKSLTLRANAHGAEASVNGTFTIAGAGISVTVQGLVFPSGLSVTQAADVKILENTFGGDISVPTYKTSEGDGKLTIIGNHLTSGDIWYIYSEGFYVAGNVLDNGYISAYASGWIVGNQVTHFNNFYAIYVTAGPAQVIGNRVTTSAISVGNLSGIESSASPSLIAGNIVTVNNSYAVYYPNLIGISCSSTLCTVINNVVTGSAVKFSNSSAGINAKGRILGNIVYNLPFTAINKGDAATKVANNLCYLNNPNCGTADGNLEADPKFIDLINFQLAAGSPAINAGPSSLSYADLDRTRNDMGAYGGPWSIGQYDAQRDPANFAPYVFPLFKANSSVSDGSLEIFALGVARLR